MRRFSLRDFVVESNRIEGITRAPSLHEMNAHNQLLAQVLLSVADISIFVAAVAPGAMLRDRPHMNVRVGDFYPIYGGQRVLHELDHILYRANKNDCTPFALHHEYETLHPFTDGNGRSGRAIWLWMMGGIEEAQLGFLHTWYYQSLQAVR